ncbi:hypothetical protein IC582_025031 [Cucumis melo]
MITISTPYPQTRQEKNLAWLWTKKKKKKTHDTISMHHTTPDGSRRTSCPPKTLQNFKTERSVSM